MSTADLAAAVAGAPWAVVLVFGAAGVLHFVAPRAYERIMPRWLPATGPFGRRSLVLTSGAFEILGALGVLYAPTRAVAGVGLVLLLVAVLPANVEMLVAAHERRAPAWAQSLLVARLPLQLLLMWWVWAAAVQSAGSGDRMPPRAPAPHPAAPDLTITLTRHADGSTIFRLTRADGSATWQRNRGATGAFFPPHDLTHLAVETVLGHRRGFYGLVTDGWDLDDFGPPWRRGRLVDLDPSEFIVGFLDRTGLHDAPVANAAALNEAAALFFASSRADPASVARWRDLTDAELAAVRARARELVAVWHALPTGETLTLPFTRAPAAP